MTTEKVIFDPVSLGICPNDQSYPEPPPPKRTPRTPEEKAALRAQRIADCGQLHHRLNPASGTWYAYHAFCGYWRECPTCLGHRASEFAVRFAECKEQAGDDLEILQCNDTIAKRVVRQLRKAGSDYWRIPTEEGCIIFFDGFLHDLDSNLTVEDVDWTDLANTPERKRFTGNLGKVEEEEEDRSSSILVKVPSIHIKGIPASEVADAYEEAIAETWDLEPEFDEEELQQAIYDRSDAFVEVVETWGYEVTTTEPISKWVAEQTYIGWKKENDRVRADAEKRLRDNPAPEIDVTAILAQFGVGEPVEKPADN